MKKGLLLTGFALFTLAAGAQQLQKGQIKWPSSEHLHTYINNWKPGTQIFEDENFFISRVKPKARFRNTATQVNETLTDKNDKKLIFWVPVNNVDDVNANALPNGKFDSEVFSTWSYVTHYGNWTSPFGWVPGAFADAAHKNGVAVSGVASVPFGPITSAWKVCLEGMSKVDADKLVQFLNYHGTDGLAYNAEFSGLSSSVIEELGKRHEAVLKGLKEKGNPAAENIWYDGTNDNGYISFDGGLGEHNNGIFGSGSAPRTSFFFNYNWWTSTVLNSVSETSIEKYAPGRSALDIYAGFNMQGSNPSTWTSLANSPMSIGLWGGHQFNYLWSGRANLGSQPMTMQKYYQTILERFFTNYNSNPINSIAVYNASHHFPNAGWFGMSAMMSARSSLKWDLAEEPFISYFNVGNGLYFNWKGERQNNNEWYNLGVQDYMPTWRYWFANQFLGKTKANVVANGLKAEITFEDAYMGGSCLRIYGTSADEYLHLFKTEYALETGDVITIRYKLMGGKTDANLSLSLKGAEGTEVQPSALKFIELSTESDDSQWVEKKFTVSGRLNTLTSSELAMVALHFTGAENLDLYLGEFSITRGSHAAPAKPEITLVKPLAYNVNGADVKLIWNMPNDKAAGEPCYNLDVKTSMFKLWSQQEGKEPVLIGTTTSWAAVLFAAPMVADGGEKLRVGVSASSLDNSTESEIAWSEYQTLPAYVTSDNIQITKSTIKPGESFTISYVDPKHDVADWKLTNGEGTEVASASGTTTFSVDGLDNIGAYDLTVTCNGKETKYPAYVQISSWSVGAYPEIKDLIIKDAEGKDISNGDVVISLVDNFEFSYTGRESDGAASRAISAQEGYVGADAGDMGIEAGKSFAVAAWVKMTSMPKPTDGHSTACFFGIEDRQGNWPQCDWGWHYVDLSEDGRFNTYAFPDSRSNNTPRVWYDFPNTKLELNSWTHVVMTFEYDANRKFRSRLFINGKQQESTWQIASDDNSNGANRPGNTVYSTGKTNDWASQNYIPINASDGIKFFGGRGGNPSFSDGIIDEFQVYGGDITEEDVLRSYQGLDENNLPSNLLCYWSFDNEPNSDKTFSSLGSKPGVKLKNYTLSGGHDGAEQLLSPIFEAGSPFIPGSSYKVTSTPTWKSTGAVITNATGSATEGSANIRFRRTGSAKVTLTLTNSIGSDTKEYPVIRVVTGIEAVTESNVNAYTAEGMLFVEFDQDGSYAVDVYGINGAVAASRTADVTAGQMMSIALGSQGVYVVNVKKDGKIIRTVKVMNK